MQVRSVRSGLRCERARKDGKAALHAKEGMQATDDACDDSADETARDGVHGVACRCGATERAPLMTRADQARYVRRKPS